VFATASGKEGVEVQEMGAHAAVDGKRVHIDDYARRFAPDGVDAVLALAGGALEQCLNVLRPDGVWRIRMASSRRQRSGASWL
jgi:NADPH:quinone reductase-like Zn-dependent oxidoreductase